MADTSIAVRDQQALDKPMEIDALIEQVALVQKAMAAVMKDGEHYGVIPGTDKPTLYKPGAEKLCLLFRLAPTYGNEMIWHDDGHLTVVAKCALKHINSGNLVAEGEGLCTSREEKYAFRKAERVCPLCGVAAIIKGKAEYGGGWVCWKKKDGCDAKFIDDDARILDQESGQVPNPRLPDTHNTILKMACKRALVAAVLNGTAASDIFTQDIEDLPDFATTPAPAAEEAAPSAGAGITTETTTLLNMALTDLNYDDAWLPETVWRNATRKFGRQITEIGDLTEDQAQQILTGAREYMAANPPPVYEDPLEPEITF